MRNKLSDIIKLIILLNLLILALYSIPARTDFDKAERAGKQPAQTEWMDFTRSHASSLQRSSL